MEIFHRLRPLLPFVKFVEILTFAQQVRQTYLMVQEVKREVCAMTVCDCGHPLQRVSEPVFKFLPLAAFAVEYQSEIYGLRYPCPVKAFVAVTARFVEADNRRLHYILYILFDFLDGGFGSPFSLVDPVDHRPLTDFQPEHLLEKRGYPVIRQKLYRGQIDDKTFDGRIIYYGIRSAAFRVWPDTLATCAADLDIMAYLRYKGLKLRQGYYPSDVIKLYAASL